MLKKISHISLAFLILVTSVGFTFSKHYCGSTLKSVSVVVAPESCCEIPSGCCHDETTTIKLENDFSFSLVIVDISQNIVEKPALIDRLIVSLSVIEPITHTIHKPPPLPIQTILSSLQTYLL